MITEEQLHVMETGASHEVEMLCAEVRRLRDGIREVIDRYRGRDHAAPLLELGDLLRGDA